MNSLVIYDSNGRIYSILYGASESDVPLGLQSMWVVIPDGSILRNIDVSDPENHKPVFDTYLNVNLEDIRKDINEVNEKVNKISKEGRIALMQKAMTFAAVTFTDAQALQVPELYPVWSSDSVSYVKDERVRYNDILYKVLQNHTSQESWTPDAATSLFAKVLIPDPEVIPDWEQPGSENAYKKGDRVKHKGKTWESLVDNNVWEPGNVGSENLWKEVVES